MKLRLLKQSVQCPNLILQIISQICNEGQCRPFYPDGIEQPDDTTNEIDTNDIDNTDQAKDPEVPKTSTDPQDIIDGRPAWYDPIFTEMFIELRMK